MNLLSRRQVPVACLVVAFAVAPALAARQAQSPRWWKSEATVKELGLTAEQSTRIEEIFETTVLELRQEWEELDRLESKLSRMIKDDRHDEATIARQIDRVETARAGANKTRSLMLMRMRRVLTPDQRIRLEQIMKRRDAKRSQF